ncbi:hypothetical protein GIB67_029870 [Kingdonia uniflora]|uniref:Uncharacterized protein n=1 Tax=Kingdonia uniflora TaxID=39325 RepID=A0A7J7NJU8_9MAGN|nr:hypothetical protein GIB67_029870 [Kingdonia uniflora]
MQPFIPSPLHLEMGELTDYSSSLPYVPQRMAIQRLTKLLSCFFLFRQILGEILALFLSFYSGLSNS